MSEPEIRKRIINNGGMAFPGFSHTEHRGKLRRNAQGDWEHYVSGMTLRAWLAGLAMQGELAAQSEQTGVWDESHLPMLAARSCKIADALIAELNKETPH